MEMFLARLVFRIIDHEKSAPEEQINELHLFDEQLRLLVAEDWESALRKAKRIGEFGQLQLTVVDNYKVKSDFVNVSELIQLSNAADGHEICGRLREVSDPGRYISDVNRKATRIAGEYIIKDLNL